LVVMNQFRICMLCPTPRGCIDFVWKDAHGSGNRHVFWGEKWKLTLPIQTSRGNRRVRKPIECDVVQDVVSRKAFKLPIEDPSDERVAACIVVEHPGAEADGRIRNPRQRLAPTG